MLLYELIVAFSYSVVIAMTIGLVRLGKILRAYRPFVFILVLSFLGELANTFMALYYKTNAISANVYVLLECYLWLWQFQRWGTFKKKIFTSMAVGLCTHHRVDGRTYLDAKDLVLFLDISYQLRVCAGFPMYRSTQSDDRQ